MSTDKQELKQDTTPDLDEVTSEIVDKLRETPYWRTLRHVLTIYTLNQLEKKIAEITKGIIEDKNKSLESAYTNAASLQSRLVDELNLKVDVTNQMRQLTATAEELESITKGYQTVLIRVLHWAFFLVGLWNILKMSNGSALYAVLVCHLGLSLLFMYFTERRILVRLKHRLEQAIRKNTT